MGNKAPIRLIRDEEILAWVKQDDTHTYRYKGNIPGFYVLLAAGGITLIGGVAVAIWLPFESRLILAALLGLFTIWSYWTVFHWWIFSIRNYVGLNDDEFLVGRGSKAYVIPTSRLTREAVDVTLMRRGKYTGVLPIRVDHLKLAVHLYGPFSNLDQLPEFTANVLSYLMDDEETALMDDEETS